MKKWECTVCGFIYDEEKGLLRDGIKPGVEFEDVDRKWICPDCQMGKDKFTPLNGGST